MFAKLSAFSRRTACGPMNAPLRTSTRALSTAKTGATKTSKPNASGAMKLSVYRSLWGVLHSSDGWMTLEEAIPKVQQLGFEGVECPILVPLDYGKEKFRDLLQKHNLKYIPMLFTDGPVAPGAAHFNGKFKGHPAPAPGPEAHAAVLEAQFQEALWFKPEKINSHTGNDYMSVKEAFKLFESAIAIEKAAGGSVKLMHETHRKRFLHSPWVVRDFVPKYFPDLKLVADLSHFTCVAETNPLDPNLTAVIKLIAPNVHHIHGRIGYDHGPQVNDPRAPEWAEYVEGFEKWWQIIWAAQAKGGMQVTTLSPEHGPPNYQHTVPYTRQPLANIWEINTWVQQRVLKLFATGAHLKGAKTQKPKK